MLRALFGHDTPSAKQRSIELEAELRRAEAATAERDAQIRVLEERLLHVRSPELSGGEDDLNTERLLAHPLRAPAPHIRLGTVPARDNPDRIAIAGRLIEAYHKSMADEAGSSIKRAGDDTWTVILRRELSELVELLESRDAERLADFLLGFGSSFVWFGGVSTSVDGYNRNLDPHHVALSYWDKLCRLAEAVGVAPIENPESGDWGDILQRDPAALVADIEAAIGIPVLPPLGVVHTDGVAVGDPSAGGGLMHYRHINSLYAALRLQAVLDGKACRTDPLPPSVCEYGGGVGLIAFYARRLGITDYTIFDIPLTCLLSAHYLLHACGPEAVSLYGEPEAPDQIKVRPFWTCRDAADDRFSVTVNQDGLNEIADELRAAYLEEISRTTRHAFLSFNHEVFFPKTVANLMAGSPRFHRLYRAPYWPREGYVEELFEID